MFSRHRRKIRVVFGLADVLITAAAFLAAYESRVLLPFDRAFYLPNPTKALLLGFSALVWLAIGVSLGVYDRLEAGNPRLILRDSFRQTALGVLCVVVFQYLLRLPVPLSRSFLGLFAVYSWVGLCLFRLSSERLTGVVRREFGAVHFVMVVGVGESARRLARALEQAGQYGVKLLGFLAENAAEAPQQIRLDSEYPVHPLSDLPALLRRQVIDEVLFAVDSGSLAGLAETLVLCDEEGVRTRVMVDFFPHVNSEIYLERLGSLPLLTFSATPHDELRLMAKRTGDVAVSALALAVLLPLMALVAILVRLTSPGPAIFRQVRCGINGRRFICYKFRSMCQNAEQLQDSLKHLSSKSTAFKIPNDPRLTPLGRYLRKFSIDEWPQFWNVLKGDMSLVGPRPAVPGEVENYRGWQRRRLRMRPGLTCLWALEGRDKLDFETWMKLDMEYIDNWSLTLDWKILLRTIPHVALGRGAN